jgi:hypothetical protein
MACCATLQSPPAARRTRRSRHAVHDAAAALRGRHLPDGGLPGSGGALRGPRQQQPQQHAVHTAGALALAVSRQQWQRRRRRRQRQHCRYRDWWGGTASTAAAAAAAAARFGVVVAFRHSPAAAAAAAAAQGCARPESSWILRPQRAMHRGVDDCCRWSDRAAAREDDGRRRTRPFHRWRGANSRDDDHSGAALGWCRRRRCRRRRCRRRRCRRRRRPTTLSRGAALPAVLALRGDGAWVVGTASASWP